MNAALRFNIADQRLVYQGEQTAAPLSQAYRTIFNHLHASILEYFDLELVDGSLLNVSERINQRSNLGVFRNRHLRQSVILAAALSAIGVRLTGFDSLKRYPGQEKDKALINALKRDNDRTAAQVMAEVLQMTTENFPVGEEVVIESAITEGVRIKPGKETGGNPTIAVGTLYGKEAHRRDYGGHLPANITRLSMGNDVIDGTTKSVKGRHSSLTALFLTESGVKRHLPDIYVQRWMAGTYFEEFAPREVTLVETAQRMAAAYDIPRERMSAYFLDRPRHLPAMDELNAAGVSTPFDKDGDLFPAILLGQEGLVFPDGRGLCSMIGEIGGSAEWAVGVLPLVWRGGQAIGMLTSQSALTTKNSSPQELWENRFNFTEEELMLIQDARFEQKPYFTISDILDAPFAGGMSAFGAISDNYFYPAMQGVRVDEAQKQITVHVMVVNSLGMLQLWRLVFQCRHKLEDCTQRFVSPKQTLRGLAEPQLEKVIGTYLADALQRMRLHIFFVNEYYPAIIHTRGKMVLLDGALNGLIERGALKEEDRAITQTIKRMAPEWFL